MEKQNAWGRGMLFYNGEEIVSRFRNDFLLEVCLKHVKGIFFEEFKQPLPDNYKRRINPLNLLKSDIEKFKQWLVIRDWLHKFDWKYSGHPDIFRYIIQPIKQGMPLDGTAIPFTGKEDAVYSIVICNNTFTTITEMVRMPD